MEDKQPVDIKTLEGFCLEGLYEHYLKSITELEEIDAYVVYHEDDKAQSNKLCIVKGKH